LANWIFFKRKKATCAPAFSVVANSSSIIGSRPTQQDYILLPGEDVSLSALNKKGYMAVLCDGMGGLEGGETASRVCANTLMNAYYQREADDPCDFYRAVLPEADSVVAKLTDDAGELFRCGTTVTSAIIRNRRLYWASVGDSRVYLLRKGKLSRLSKDHNHGLALAAQYAAGEISELDMLLDKQRNALISFIGIDGLELMDISREEQLLDKGDMALLCSDGLYHALRDEEIEETINAYEGRLGLLPEVLTEMASDRDWILHDNISVVVLGLQ